MVRDKVAVNLSAVIGDLVDSPARMLFDDGAGLVAEIDLDFVEEGHGDDVIFIRR